MAPKEVGVETEKANKLLFFSRTLKNHVQKSALPGPDFSTAGVSKVSSFLSTLQDAGRVFRTSDPHERGTAMLHAFEKVSKEARDRAELNFKTRQPDTRHLAVEKASFTLGKIHGSPN